MTRRLRKQMRRFAADERGYVLPLVAVALPVIFGTTALAIDFSYVLYTQKALQSATDQAALAAAQGLADGTYTAKAKLYSSSAAAGGVNTISGVPVPAANVSVTPRCSTTMSNAGVTCVGPASANAVKVQQTATVPLFFGSAIGLKPMTVTATGYASGAGGKYPQLNVMIVLDTTQSMTQTDSKCTIGKNGAAVSKVACAENGTQSILSQLYPTIDYVGLEVFPGLQTASVSKDLNCTGLKSSDLAVYGSPGFTAKTSTATYTIAGLSSTCMASGTCYRTSNTATGLNSSSALVQAVGNGTTAGCMQALGGMGTFYADSITAAQTQLAAFKTSLGSNGANSQNVIILLSDGDANAKSGSQIVAAEAPNQCTEAITAATNAKAAGTLVYVVGYAPATSGGCSTDTGKNAVTPYCALAQISSGQKYFFSDVNPPAASTCAPVSWTLPAASANIASAFSNIGSQLASVRLIPATVYNN